MTTAFDFHFQDVRGNALPLSRFSGHPMVVVNTASKCGFTPQYAGLETLWRTWRERGLIVLGVPCNDFGNQEPGENADIATFSAEKYGVDFPLTAKTHVRGPDAHPMFQWMAEEGGFFARPRWNFYKYLIGKNGQFRGWFGSITPPSSHRFAKAVEKLVGP